MHTRQGPHEKSQARLSRRIYLAEYLLVCHQHPQRIPHPGVETISRPGPANCSSFSPAGGSAQSSKSAPSLPRPPAPGTLLKDSVQQMWPKVTREVTAEPGREPQLPDSQLLDSWLQGKPTSSSGKKKKSRDTCFDQSKAKNHRQKVPETSLSVSKLSEVRCRRPPGTFSWASQGLVSH